jgi:hypothetical protein
MAVTALSAPGVGNEALRPPLLDLVRRLDESATKLRRIFDQQRDHVGERNPVEAVAAPTPPRMPATYSSKQLLGWLKAAAKFMEKCVRDVPLIERRTGLSPSTNDFQDTVFELCHIRPAVGKVAELVSALF